MTIPSLPGKRRALSALAAMLLAFGAGYVMQHVLVDQTPMARVDELPDAAGDLRSSERSRALPTPPAATLVPTLPPAPVMPDRVDKPVHEAPETWDDARMSPFGFSCDPELALTVGDAAMVEVRLFAPCNGLETVTLRHGALYIEVRIDGFGRANAVIPALATLVDVEAALSSRDVRARVAAPDARAFSRVVLVWEGPQVFHMNAYELGAKRGQPGHIRAGWPRTPSRAMRGTGGFLTMAGDGSGRTAEIYTFPTGFSPLRGVVRLVVEADVTAETCGRTAEATALQSGPLGGMTATDVRVTLPGCDSAGAPIEFSNLSMRGF